MRIELTFKAWEALVLPLNYTRNDAKFYLKFFYIKKDEWLFLSPLFFRFYELNLIGDIASFSYHNFKSNLIFLDVDNLWKSVEN